MTALPPGVHIRAIGHLYGVKGAPAMFRRSSVAERVLWGHLVPVRVAAVIEPRDGGTPHYETWAADSLRLPPVGKTAGVYVGGHRVDGGTRVGRVSQLVQGRAWIDAALVIDDGEIGDAVLEDIGPGGGRLPLSIGFLADPGRSIRNNGGPVPEVLRQQAMVCEVAIVERAAFDGAYTYAPGVARGLAQAFV